MMFKKFIVTQKQLTNIDKEFHANKQFIILNFELLAKLIIARADIHSFRLTFVSFRS